MTPHSVPERYIHDLYETLDSNSFEVFGLSQILRISPGPSRHT